MNKIYKKNLEAIKKRYPDLAQRINNTVVGNKYKLIKDSDGSYNLGIFSSKKLYYPSQKKRQALNTQLKKQRIKNAVIAVFLGFGLGYELMVYYENFSKHVGTKYMCVFEKDIEIFKHAMKCHDFSSVIKNKDVEIYIGEKLENLFPKFVKYFDEGKKIVYLNAIKPIYTNSALDLFGEYYIECSKTFKKAAKNKIFDYGDSPVDSLVGTENMLSNLDEIIKNPGINCLKNKFKNKPGIVIATGPSLDKNIHLLEGIGDRAVLVAAEASLRPLVNRGLKPHIITSLERTIPIMELVKGFTEEQVKEVYLGACPVVDRTVYEEYKGPRVIIYRNFNHFKWLNIDKGILDIKISSGNMAFKVCEYLGCNPIILIGQDLAHTDEGKTHATGFDFPDQEDDKYDLVQVKGNIKDFVWTTKAWISALNAYIRDIDGYKGLCINSTEGGAFIQGTTVMPFKEALGKHIHTQRPFSPIKKIQQALNVKDIDSDKQKKEVLKLIKNTKIDIDHLLEGYEKAITILENNISLLSKLKKEKEYDKTQKKKIDTISQEFGRIIHKTDQENLFTLQYYLAHIIQSLTVHYSIKHFSIPNDYDSFQQAVPEQLLLKKDYYQNLIKTIKNTYSSLENAQRLLEEGHWKRTENNILFHKMSMKQEDFIKYKKYFKN